MTYAQPLKILHVITDLNMGGAEMVLYRLLGALDRKEFSSEVVSLTSFGSVGGWISDLGITVTTLGVRPGFPDPRLVTRLRRLVQSRTPHLIQSWMYHSDLSAGLAARLAGSPPVVWGLHHTVGDRGSLKPATFAVARLNAWLSGTLPAQIVCCAEATRKTHIDLGYKSDKMLVIPNGIDPVVFHPNLPDRLEVRHELSLGDKTPVIGLCARFDPQKDHETFIRAAGLLHERRPEVHFILWGENVDTKNKNILGWIHSTGVEGVIHLLGLRQDSARLMAALDIAALSSYGEAFPLVVGEAMACGIPCVVTDVGDSATLVGETGRVVPSRDHVALANAWAELLDLPESERILLGSRARKRIIDHYSLERMAESYSQLYRDIIADINFQ
jgi:glycosyltransferase involved in cell wall biosynthesis